MSLIKKILTDWLKSAVEILMLSLTLCVITVIVMPSPLCYFWVAFLPLFSLLGVLVNPFLKRIPVLECIVDILASAALAYCFGLLTHTEAPVWICMGVLGIVLSLRARAIALHPWSEVTAVYLYTLFMAFNLIFALMAGVVPVLKPFLPAAMALGPVIVLAGLLTMNELNIANLTDVQKDKLNAGNMVVSRTMKRQNRIMLLVIYAAVLLLSLLQVILTFLKWLARMIYKGLSWLIDRFADVDASGNGGGGDSTPDLSGLVEKVEEVRNPFWQRVEEILVHTVAYIAVAAFAIFLLYMLYKGIRKLIAWLRSVKFGGESDDAGVEEYVDTRELLVDLKDLPAQYLKRARDWITDQLKREPDWKTLKTAEERVRALYRRAIYKATSGGYTHKTSDTASEVLPQVGTYLKTDSDTLRTLGTYYDEVRYGGHEPDAKGIEDMNRKI